MKKLAARCSLTLSALALVALAPLANAHPGHSITESSPAHLLTSPDHLAALALIGGAMCLGARFVHRRLPRRALQLGGTLAVVSSVVLWSLRS